MDLTHAKGDGPRNFLKDVNTVKFVLELKCTKTRHLMSYGIMLSMSVLWSRCSFCSRDYPVIEYLTTGMVYITC